MNRSDRIDQGLSRLGAIAPGGYALALHIRFTSALIIFNTYTPRWIEHYMQRGYALCDPVISWGLAREGVWRWSELDIPDPHDIFGQAADFGLRYGVAVSSGVVSSRSIGGLARSDREFTRGEMTEVAAVFRMLHDVTTPPESLTPAQRIALQLIATGSRHSEAAAQLEISESALKARLKSARDRLSARTTVEAIRKAQDANLL